MQISIEVADEVAASYGEIYGHTSESQVPLDQFIADSLETYLENAHVGLVLRTAEATAKEPFAEKQAIRAERAQAAKPELVEDAEEAPGAEPVKGRIR